MDVQVGNTSRRGSLAISALLNEDTAANLNQQASGDVSSGTISPVSGSQTTSSSSSSKVKRKRISPMQYNRLMEIFDQTDTPSSEIRENLADELKMTKREVQVIKAETHTHTHAHIWHVRFFFLNTVHGIGLVSKS